MQVCLIKAQVKSGAGVRCEWWRTDRSVTRPAHKDRLIDMSNNQSQFVSFSIMFRGEEILSQ